MKNILVIHSSPRAKDSLSRKLADVVVKKIEAQAPSAEVRTFDLALNPPKHLDGAHLAAFFTPVEKYTDADREILRYSENAIAHVLAADTIVISVPMTNLSIPSVLKAWIDQVSRAGRTFRYTEHGPEGLVTGKKVYLVIASGGVYSEGPMKAYDFTESYLRAALGFLGMTDVTAYRVEGAAIPGIKETALEKAIESVRI